MPEGREAFTISKGLNDILSNKYLTGDINVLYNNNRSINNNDITLFNNESPHLIQQIYSKGKRVIFQLKTQNNKQKYLFTTLNMTGHYIISKIENKNNINDNKKEIIKIQSSKHYLNTFNYNKLDRISFFCTSNIDNKQIDNNENYIIIFRDQRKFGKIEYLSQEDLDIKLSQLGPDFLRDKISKKKFIKIFRSFTSKRSKTLKISTALLDQKILSGIGNYMRADILYLSKISPYRTINEISDNELNILRKACKTVAETSAKCGGNTISNYFLPTGKPGSYSTLVYGKDITKDGNIIQKDTIAGRSIFWSPSIQK